MKSGHRELVRAAVVTLILMGASGGVARSQHLETLRHHDDWMETRLGESHPIRWRIIGQDDLSSGRRSEAGMVGATLKVEVSEPNAPRGISGVTLDLWPCSRNPEIDGVYRHRGAAVAVLRSRDGSVNNQGTEMFSTCLFAVRLSPSPEVLFQRHLFESVASSRWVKSSPQGYRFVPLHDLLLVVMEGSDGVLPWPVDGEPAAQSWATATIMPRWAQEIATMPEDARSRMAPVATTQHSGWAVLQEPFTSPPRRMILGERTLGRGSFSAELSYNSPRLQVETVHGQDDDTRDPWPDSDFPLADYRWKELEFGPQVPHGEVETVATGSNREIYIIRWPCRNDPYDWEPMVGYSLPTVEEWVVAVQSTGPLGLDVRTHLARTCETFQMTPFFYGRGGFFRTFENGTIEKIVERGRTVGVAIYHARPRILSAGGGRNPLPDEREIFEQHWPGSDWWQPFFDGDEEDSVAVVRVDGEG